ncbi:MAG TPA: aminotransferase class V-fold PLP-dependent enzyme [Coleofasciculaceae cyanobacterium]|jgi:isopenicillin-N epimerase
MTDKAPFPGEPSSWAKFWSLDQTITFLNHGSYGACPVPVMEAQQRLRSQLERQPLRFFMREFEALLDSARRQLAAFVGGDADELVFVPNATTGVNSVLRSLSFNPGDELLTTNQEYNACRNAFNFVAQCTGAKVVVATVPFPLESPNQVVEAVIERVSPKTRLALLDHVTSQTALIFPMQQLVSQLSALGVDTLVDGAHAPGMVPLNLHEIGATYYTGNCHKWLCAPKGAGFLYVQRDKQSAIHPLTISHGANAPLKVRDSFGDTPLTRFQLEFDWTGTDDPTAYLCIPEAIRFLGSLLPGAWSELMEQNRAKALLARQILCEALGVSPPCPTEMIGSMVVVPLPDKLAFYEQSGQPRGWPVVQEKLFKRFNIEVPVIPWTTPFQQMVRVSAQLYNTPEQYEYLAMALLKLLSD